MLASIKSAMLLGVDGVVVHVEVHVSSGIPGYTVVVLPPGNASEAALVGGIDVLVCANLAEARACLKGEQPWPPVPPAPAAAAAVPGEGAPDGPTADLGDVRGLDGARRALEVAAAGGHHLLLVGPPGAGKTLLAHCLPSILPPLEPGDALEVTKIHSAAGQPVGGALLSARPFRDPHHTYTSATLVVCERGRNWAGQATPHLPGSL